MKVLCINADNNRFGKKPSLVENRIYDTIGEMLGDSGIDHWLFSGLEYGGYGKYRFIPLSKIDETEMIREIQISKA